jgi:PKD repeat protein
MRIFIGLCILTVIAALPIAPALQANAEELIEPGVLPPPFSQKATGPMAKADWALRQLVGEFLFHRGDPAQFRPSNEHLQYAPGRVAIDAIASGDPARLMEDLRGLGLTHAAQAGPIVSGLFPIGAIQRMVRLDSVRAVRASWRPVTNIGQVTSEGVYAMGADMIPTFETGLGSTIGILSDSFDQKGDTSLDQANGDLPANVNILDDSANCGNIFAPKACNDEGRAMAQLADDVAPGANIAFHTAFTGDANFAQGIRDLAAAGADVIVDDVMYFNEPMFQDGVIAQAVDDVVADGISYFSSAGNSARSSFEAPFDGSGEILYVNGLFGQEYRGELHDFNPDPSVVDWHQGLTIPAGTTISLSFQWDQPSSAVAPGKGSQSDYDIYISSGNTILASSIDDNIASGVPLEILSYTNSSGNEQNVDLLITHFDGPEASLMKYVMFGGLNVTIEYATNSPTLFGHANAAGAEAVGAAFYQRTPAYGVDPAELEWFSSAGGVPILFGSNGQALSTPDVREKPNVVGPDGANTTFFWSDSASDLDDWPNFFGTSAAAPHVAAVAALMKEANSSATPAEIYAALESTALDMNETGFDNDSGYGFVWAPDAVAAIGGGSGGGTVSAPTASFSVACDNFRKCTFSNISTTSGSTTWLWDFGDGNSASVASPVHTYDADGTYAVTLTATNEAGTDSDTQSVSVVASSTGTPDACDGLSDGVHLYSSSSNEGRTWTATVNAVNCVGGDLATFDPVPSSVSMWWSPSEGSVTENCSTSSTGECQASQSGIRKRTASVEFGLNGEVITISKP